MKTRYIHGVFYTLNPLQPKVNELWVDDGMISHVGSHPEWQADQTIDVQGWTCFPGFVDSHLHLIGYGEHLSLLQLRKNPNPQEVLSLVKAQFQGRLLYAQGHVEQALTKSDLDIISSSVPILLRHADFHGATVNSAMLNQIGLSTHPTGILHEADALKAVQAIPRYHQNDLIKMITVAIQKLHEFGITGGHTDDLYYFNGFHEVVSAYQKVLTTLPFRTHLLIHHLELDNYEQWMNTHPVDHPWLEFGAVGEIFYDGTLSSQTALMHHPYQGGQGYGQRQFTSEQWLTIVQRVRALGLPLAVHAIGDLALDEVVDTLIANPVKAGLQDRIIHASFAKKATLDKLTTIPVMLDIQPQFITSDLPWASEFISNQTELIYPFKTYLNHGLILCGGSDAPVEVPDPLKGIEAAYQRYLTSLGASFQSEECLSMVEAVQLYTTGANAPSYQSHRQGKLLVGSVADLTFISEDFIANPTRLADAKVMMTVVHNQIVFRKKSTT
jgi:predicted amidohydrolase YtcJ